MVEEIREQLISELNALWNTVSVQVDNSMVKRHWGELPKEPIPVESIPDVTEDIEKSMIKCCLDEYEDDTDIKKNENIVLPSMDPLMLYAISLHKYTNYMIEMIGVAELAIEKKLIPPEDAAPPIPQRPDITLLQKRNSLNYLPKDFTPFSIGQELELPELNDVIAKKVLSKCIATMLAHIGFETTHQSILDILFDVMERFFEKLGLKIVEVIEDEEKGYNCGFPNVIERVLVETGMGGIRGLNDYYQCRVIKYLDVLEKRCKELNDHYARLLIPKSEPLTGDDSNLIRVKQEEDDDVIETDNPELHFTTFMGENPILEGLHLLNSLEAEQNVQNIEETSDEIISESPSVSSVSTLLSEGEICNLSPYTKKKKFK